MLAAAPALANDAAGQLCAMTNCPGINFGTYRGAPKSEPQYEPKACPECEAETLRQLNESIANMEHPTPVRPMAADIRSILNEDVVKANASFAMTSVALGLILSPPQVKVVLGAAVALTVLNAVVKPHLITVAQDFQVPVWLNMISFARVASSASKTCAELAETAMNACANSEPSDCTSNDDCRILLAKRALLLDCDRAALDLRKGDCPDIAAGIRKKMEKNSAEVNKCGRLISGNPKCCPESVRAAKKSACPDTPAGCKDENLLALNGLLGRSAGVTEVDCRNAREKKAAAERCGDARRNEGAQCYEGQLDAGHQDILNDILRNAAGCGSFLEGARRFGLCP